MKNQEAKNITLNLSKSSKIGQFALCCPDDPTPTPGAEPGDQSPQINPDDDLETPHDAILDFINNQAPNDEQLEQVLQSYQALTSPTIYSSPTRSMNTHITHHVDKALQSKRSSLEDRGANGV